MRQAIVMALGAWVAATAPAAAQGFSLSQNNNEQIQVYADQGIEWLSEDTRVIARGNAKAIRGGVTITADTLTAYYRDGKNGNEVWRLDADGGVVIATATETATGYKASYDLDQAVFVLRGHPAKLVTPNETVTADDVIEYWERDRKAVARGNAKAVQKDRTLKADVLSALFEDNAKGSMQMKHADAYGNVVVVTDRDKVLGDRGDYDTASGIATVSGAVKLIRDGNELNGGYAHVNLNSGISKLFGTAPGGSAKDSRVSGSFTPEKKSTDERRAAIRETGSAKQEQEGVAK